jgi:hypothetical protein
VACQVLATVRRHKTATAVAMRTPVARLRIVAPPATVNTLRGVLDDVAAAARADHIELADGGRLSVRTLLAGAPQR